MTAENVGGAAVDFTVVDKSEAVFVQMERNAKKAERAIVDAAANASTAGEGIGAGMAKSAAAADRSTKQIITGIERTIAMLKAGERGSADFYEALAKNRGANATQLAPYIAQLRELKTPQELPAKTAVQLA